MIAKFEIDKFIVIFEKSRSSTLKTSHLMLTNEITFSMKLAHS